MLTEPATPFEHVTIANRRRVVIIAFFVVANLGFRLFGIDVPASVFLIFAGWIALALSIRVVPRWIRSPDDVERVQLAAFVGDVTFLTAHHFFYSHGWWMGALFYAIITIGAQSLVSRSAAQVVTAYSLVAFNVLVLGQAAGLVGTESFLPVPSLEAQWGLAIIVAASGSAGLLGLAEMQRALVRAVRSSEIGHRLILETASDMIFTCDLQGRFLTMNPAVTTLSGYAHADLIGRQFVTNIVPEDRDTAIHRFSATVEGVAQRYDIRYFHRDRTTRWLSCVTSPMRERGQITGVLVVARDTTEERAREHHLRQTERLASLGTLVGGVAHELNNPLTGIKCFAEMLLEDGRTEDRESLTIIRREADRAAKIVSDLRLVARQTYDGQASERSVVDLNDVVAHVLRVRRYSLETRSITVRTETAEGLAMVEGNRSEIEQVLLNIVVNAEQAMERQDTPRMLIIRTRASSVGVCVQVVDSGPGIAPNDLGRIFDPFWTTKSPGEGTGLGLSLVHSIVVEHGGVIRADSNLGKGAVFTIDLPVMRAPSIAATAQRESPHAVVPRRVLVVDDEESIRRSLVRFLERRGHNVAVAASGAEALRRIDEPDGQAFDVILTDLRMPDLGGDQLFRVLRDRGHGLEQRLVFVTGDSATSSAHEFLAGSGQPVLMKPFALEELAHIVETHAASFNGGSNGAQPTAVG